MNDRQAAAQALRALIEKMVLTPGAKRGELEATLYGEPGTMLSCADRRSSGGNLTNKNTPGGVRAGVSVSLVAGVGFEPTTFRL